MDKYSKAIGATVGAAVAWGAVLGIDWLASVDIDAWTNAIMIIGSGLGAWFAPKNA